MDFSPTEAQLDLASLTRTILTDRLTPARLRELDDAQDRIDSAPRFDPVLWSALAEAGVLAAALPPEVGGSGFGVLEQCSVLVEIGRAVGPVPYLASIVMATSALAAFGDEDQRDRWARPAARGELVLTAALEEAAPTRATARPDGRWVLSGTRTAIPAGPVADLVLVPAETAHGPTVFLVGRGDEEDGGATSMQRQRMVDADDAGWLELTDVVLDGDRVLGGVGAGAAVVNHLRARGTVGLCALQLGVTERALELTAEYARTRVQFDRPIGAFQAVAQRLADAYVDVEAIRLSLWQAAWQLSAGRDAAVALATAKFWAADAGHRVAHTAVHVHGGVGLDLDHQLHRYFLAAKRHEFTLGGATAQLLDLGALLARA